MALAGSLLIAGCQSAPARPATASTVDTTAQPAGTHVVATADSAAAPTAPHEAEQPFAAAEVAATEPEPLEDEGDFWEALREELALPDYSDQPRVQAFIAWHQCNPDFLQRVTARGEPYLHLIKEEVEARGMPAELVLLPIVESAFVPFAYSHGRASGIWQFIPATGRHFGLRQDWWYDGRRDILASTRAALDYLDRLHRQFDGDWLLALAAYNTGAGNVRKAIRRNLKLGKPTDFWHLDLPKETRFYVPKLLAVAEIVRNPDLYGIELWPVADQPYLVKVDTGGQIDLALAADLAGISLEDLYQLNPGFNRWATSPRGPHYLLLPIENATRFSERIQQLPAEERVTWVRHRIRSGETLSHIAKCYHTTVAILREVNNLHGSTIRAGHHLLVPTSSRPLDRYTLSEQQRRQRLLSKAHGDRRIEYRVRRGDTLWDIARAHHVSVNRLAKWNGMAPGDPLKPGRTLVIWKSAHSATTAAPLRVSAALPVGKPRTIRYTVRKGDSLYRIASRFRVSVADIRRWNRIREDGLLRPGQRLTLHIDITRTDS
ncbi:MAG: LysM peptidoglycan-binding domain-containing protein [Gammaproteobacteria bacterium]|nr:MAG: LysM peptidoglycan-binding domain-containing protein [Gammaproteobacteria bacterium]